MWVPYFQLTSTYIAVAIFGVGLAIFAFYWAEKDTKSNAA
jgi:hypothetical protein